MLQKYQFALVKVQTYWTETIALGRANGLVCTMGALGHWYRGVHLGIAIKLSLVSLMGSKQWYLNRWTIIKIKNAHPDFWILKKGIQ